MTRQHHSRSRNPLRLEIASWPVSFAAAIAALLAICGAGQAAMVSVDTTGGADDTGLAATSTTVVGAIDLTIAGFDIAATNSDRMLLVAVGGNEWNGAPGTVSVSYGDQALTPINGSDTTADGIYSGLFFLSDAGISAATGDDVTVTLGGGMQNRSGDILGMAAISLYDAAQSVPSTFNHADGNGTVASTSIATTTDGAMVVAALGAGQLWHIADGSTLWAQEEGGLTTSFNAGYRTVSTAGPVNVQFDKNGAVTRNWDLSAVAVNPVPEPTTALVMLGLAGCVFRRRR